MVSVGKALPRRMDLFPSSLQLQTREPPADSPSGADLGRLSADTAAAADTPPPPHTQDEQPLNLISKRSAEEMSSSSPPPQFKTEGPVETRFLPGEDSLLFSSEASKAAALLSAALSNNPPTTVSGIPKDLLSAPWQHHVSHAQMLQLHTLILQLAASGGGGGSPLFPYAGSLLNPYSMLLNPYAPPMTTTGSSYQSYLSKLSPPSITTTGAGLSPLSQLKLEPGLVHTPTSLPYSLSGLPGDLKPPPPRDWPSAGMPPMAPLERMDAEKYPPPTSSSHATNDDPMYRHRCRYCKKPFGSDSALQIHVRSHTGERPFKCNICGNRFTTKGNLKVHFSRHKPKYPDIEMNPNPVPEHLDAIYPALLSTQNPGQRQDLNQSRYLSTDSPPPTQVVKLEAMTMESSSKSEDSLSSPSESKKARIEAIVSNATDMKALSVDTDGSSSGIESALSNPEHFYNKYLSDNTSPSEVIQAMTSASNRATSDVMKSITSSTIASDVMKSMASSSDVMQSMMSSSAGCETMKLQKLVDNIETKLTNDSEGENVMCTICHKSLSCRSALKLHHRIHSGEKPYACDLCARKFTSRGNLKLHLDTHRQRLRQQNQCHICYEHFSTHDQLDSHIRTHNVSNTYNDRSEQKPPLKLEDENVNKSESFPTSPTESETALEREAGLLEIDENPEDLEVKQEEPQDLSMTSVVKPSSSNSSRKCSPNHPTGKQHVCETCHKPFSSASALQIHTRTHTGDKPFKCSVCERGFTTKGNLKVHMGTHLYNGPSRRGRRSSSDLNASANALNLSSSALYRPPNANSFLSSSLFPFYHHHLTSSQAAAAAAVAANNNSMPAFLPMTSIAATSPTSALNQLKLMQAAAAAATMTESSDSIGSRSGQSSREHSPQQMTSSASC